MIFKDTKFIIKRDSGVLSPFASFNIFSYDGKFVAFAKDENRNIVTHFVKRLGKLRALAPVYLKVKDLFGVSVININSHPRVFYSLYDLWTINGEKYFIKPKIFPIPNVMEIWDSFNKIGEVIGRTIFDGVNREVAIFSWSQSDFLNWYDEGFLEVLEEDWIDISLGIALIKGLISNQWS